MAQLATPLQMLLSKIFFLNHLSTSLPQTCETTKKCMGLAIELCQELEIYYSVGYIVHYTAALVFPLPNYGPWSLSIHISPTPPQRVACYTKLPCQRGCLRNAALAENTPCAGHVQLPMDRLQKLCQSKSLPQR